MADGAGPRISIPLATAIAATLQALRMFIKESFRFVTGEVKPDVAVPIGDKADMSCGSTGTSGETQFVAEIRRFRARVDR